ncbi:MAG: hypothetical protein NTZ50_03130, partial [Chloroflexi bacterium]|nr:hypothetical protein [Chloroflexota bacterium]
MTNSSLAHSHAPLFRGLLAIVLAAGILLLVPARTTTAAPAPASVQPAPAAQTACSTVVSTVSDSGTGSLRSALACVSGGSTVTFAPAAFGTAKTITLTAQLPITRSLVISGPGSGLLTISGNDVT